MRLLLNPSHSLSIATTVCAIVLCLFSSSLLNADDTRQKETESIKIDAADLIKKIMKDRELKKKEDARRALVRELTLRAQLPITTDKFKKSWFVWNGDQLVVNQSKQIQEKVKDTIEQIRKHGFGTTMVEFRFLAVTDKTRKLFAKKMEANRLAARKTAKVPADIKAPPTVKSEKPRPFPKTPARKEPMPSFAQPASLESPVEIETRVYGVVNDDQIRELFTQIKAEKKSRIIMAPKMIGLNGQKMSCFVGQEVPFVDLDKNGKPVVRFLKDGLTTTVITVAGAENELVLDLIFENSEVVSAGKKGKAAKRVPDIPKVNQTIIQSVARIQQGQSLVMSGPKELADNKDLSVIVLVTPRPIERKSDKKK